MNSPRKTARKMTRIDPIERRAREFFRKTNSYCSWPENIVEQLVRFALSERSKARREGVGGGVAWSVDWLRDNGHIDLSKQLEKAYSALSNPGRGKS